MPMPRCEWQHYVIIDGNGHHTSVMAASIDVYMREKFGAIRAANSSLCAPSHNITTWRGSDGMDFVVVQSDQTRYDAREAKNGWM